MYSSRPSKQQQKKGMELIKKLIKSQKQVKLTIINKDLLNFQTETSMQDVLSQSQKVSKSQVSQPNISILNKVSSKEFSLQFFQLMNKPQIIDKNLIQSPKINRQRVYSQNLSFQSVESQQKSSNKIKRKLTDGEMKLNNSLQKLRHFQSNNVHSFVKFQQKTQPNLIKSQQQMTSGKQYVTEKDKNFLNSKKITQSSSKNKQNSTINQKQLELQQKLQRIERSLMTQRQSIKQIRRDFVQLLKDVRTRGKVIDEEMIEIDMNENEMETKIDKLVAEDNERKGKISVLQAQVQKLTELVKNEKSSFSQQSQILTQQILSTQETNSLTTRKIFHLKQQLVHIKQHQSLIHSKQQSNKELLRHLIKQEDTVNSLKVQKQLKLLQKRHEIKERLLDKILAESKSTIYGQLDKQLHFIKEYYKISSSSKQFKRNINKMTKFDTFVSEIKKFQSSPSYSEEIMNMYKRQLWDIGMPRFLAEQVMYIEAPEVRKLKATLKQMDAKKQSLNQILKEKQRLVTSLSFKSEKLGDQIEEMRLSEERKRQQQEIVSQIDWGF